MDTVTYRQATITNGLAWNGSPKITQRFVPCIIMGEHAKYGFRSIKLAKAFIDSLLTNGSTIQDGKIVTESHLVDFAMFGGTGDPEAWRRTARVKS